jgi:hypothetical protein
LSFVASTSFLPFFALKRLFDWLVTRVAIYSAVFDRNIDDKNKKGPIQTPYPTHSQAYL